MSKVDLTLDSFIEWLEQQPQDAVLDVSNMYNCPMTRWAKSHYPKVDRTFTYVPPVRAETPDGGEFYTIDPRVGRVVCRGIMNRTVSNLLTEAKNEAAK